MCDAARMVEIPPMVSLIEAAQIIGVGRDTVARMKEAGTLPAAIELDVPTQTLFLRSEVERMAEARRTLRDGVRSGSDTPPALTAETATAHAAAVAVGRDLLAHAATREATASVALDCDTYTLDTAPAVTP